MKRTSTIVSLMAMMVILAITPALAMPPQSEGGPGANGVANNPGRGDDLPHPLGEQLRAERQQALEAKLNGKALGKIGEVARGQYVELERTGEDSIWTVLGEFSDFPHNNIAEPDRSVDNTTIWTPDFSRDHYLNLLFSEAPGAVSMRSFYIEQSSNRYTVNGDVTDWVTVPPARVRKPAAGPWAALRSGATAGTPALT
jgi:hypothetical protein